MELYWRGNNKSDTNWHKDDGEGCYSMIKNVLGLIDAAASAEELGALATGRGLPAVPFGGKYRIMDWSLSNMANAGIDNIAVITSDISRSLLEHLGSGRDWGLYRKRDGLTVLTASKEVYIPYLLRNPRKYVCCMKGNVIANIEMQKLLRQHLQTGADVTEVMSGDRSLGAYLLEKNLLLKFTESLYDQRFSNFEDIIRDHLYGLNVSTFQVEGFAETITTVSDYYQTSLTLLNPELLRTVVSSVRSKKRDDPPTRYHARAVVRNSLIANGCVIEGYVENSVIFRGVKIDKDAVIKNSIVMSHGIIGPSAYVEHAIIDRHAQIMDEAYIQGTPERPLVLPKEMIISPDGYHHANRVYSI